MRLSAAYWDVRHHCWTVVLSGLPRNEANVGCSKVLSVAFLKAGLSYLRSYMRGPIPV